MSERVQGVHLHPPHLRVTPEFLHCSEDDGRVGNKLKHPSVQSEAPVGGDADGTAFGSWGVVRPGKVDILLGGRRLQSWRVCLRKCSASV